MGLGPTISTLALLSSSSHLGNSTHAPDLAPISLTRCSEAPLNPARFRQGRTLRLPPLVAGAPPPPGRLGHPIRLINWALWTSPPTLPWRCSVVSPSLAWLALALVYCCWQTDAPSSPPYPWLLLEEDQDIAFLDPNLLLPHIS